MALAPFREPSDFLALEFLEFEEESFREAPLRTAGDGPRLTGAGCAIRVFKFFEDFFELGIGFFFMRAAQTFIVTPEGGAKSVLINCKMGLNAVFRLDSRVLLSALLRFAPAQKSRV